MQLVKKTFSLARYVVVCLFIGSLVTPAIAQNTKHEFPFPAAVIEDIALVRSGAGVSHYVVKKLKKGQIVTVDAKIFQWYKIVPPQGVHSYVSKAFVDAKGNGKIGVVNKTPCQTYTASLTGVGDSYRPAYKLLKGDTVQIVTAEGGYYKIIPPKGTYVYIPVVKVKPAEFKPAPAIAKVVKPQPVAVVTSPKPVVVLPVFKPQPVKLIAKPVEVIKTPVEVITTPNPELAIKPKPFKPASVAAIKPQPVEPPVVVPAIQVKPQPTPIAAAVGIVSQPLRPIKITKPLPGDSMVAPKPMPVVIDPVLSATTARISRQPNGVIPPIPDTESPPQFGLAGRQAIVYPPIVSPQVSLDTSKMTELKVDATSSTDRLDSMIPSKPQLPVARQPVASKPLPAMPSFDSPVLPVAQPVASVATLPSQPAVIETGSDPVSVSPVIKSPAIAPKPTVNPLLASRKHFQAKTSTLADLEQLMIDAHQLPLDKRPLGELLVAYKKMSLNTSMPIRDQRMIQARMAQLKRDMNLSNAIRQINSAQVSLAAVVPPAPQPQRVAVEPAKTNFDFVGQLLASGVYDGQNLPRLYRLVNPADVRVTIAYIRPNDQINPAAHLGRVVGIVGQLQMDESLRLKVINPSKVEPFQAVQ